jgi:hypothetical protein
MSVLFLKGEKSGGEGVSPPDVRETQKTGEVFLGHTAS